MKKIVISIIAVILIIAIAFGIYYYVTNKKENTSEMKTIQLNEVTRSVFYAPQYAAIANGFFEEEGLKLEITTGQGADKVMTSILAGQSDIGLCGPEASIYVYNEGKEDYVEVFAQLTKRDGSFLVSKNKTDNFSWQDLKGKTVIPGRKGGVPQHILFLRFLSLMQLARIELHILRFPLQKLQPLNQIGYCHQVLSRSLDLIHFV